MELLAEQDAGAQELLVEERAVLAEAASRLLTLANTDCSQFGREEFADHTIDLVATAQLALAVSGGFVSVGEQTACSLTKGESSMVAALNTGCRISRRHGSQLDLIGSAAGRYPIFYSALLAGRITAAHIEVVHRVWRRIDRFQFNSAESDLCDLAGMCTPEEFADYLARWENHADEDEGLERFLEQQAKQHFQYGFDVFGSVHYSGAVGPEHAEPFIDTIETQAHQHKTAADLPSQALGHAVVELVLNPDGKYRAHLEVLTPENPTGSGHHRSEMITDRDDDEERRAVQAVWKAQSKLARLRARNVGRRTVPDPHDLGFSAIDAPRTARGTYLPPVIVERMRVDGARIRIHVVDRDGNIAKDRVGGRHFGEVQKRLIRLRDNRCRQPGCRRTTCEYDHIEPHEHGGQTLISNGQLLCRFHHRWKHRNDPHGSRIFNDSPIRLE